MHRRDSPNCAPVLKFQLFYMEANPEQWCAADAGVSVCHQKVGLGSHLYFLPNNKLAKKNNGMKNALQEQIKSKLLSW